MTKGFTLVEVLVVAAITVMISAFLITNFSRTRVDLSQIALQVEDGIREAQSTALAGALYTNPALGTAKSTSRCGFGIHFNADGFIIFAGPDASTVDCSTYSRTYTAGTDQIIRTALFSNNLVGIILPAPDIFFAPPNPTTYIGGNQASGVSADINIRMSGSTASCPSADCRTINVTTSGLIKLK